MATIPATTDTSPMRATDGTGQQGHSAPRHVWVHVSSGKYPGVQLERRQDIGGAWKAWVMWAEPGPAVQYAWLDAKQLTPLDS